MSATRFTDCLHALGVPADAPLGVAVSGGPDSLALLLLAAAARPGLVHAATVDHQLRPEARAEAENVRAVCQVRSIPHDILPVTVAGSVQAGAREARYAALGAWCERSGIAWLATAHHADDQAETLLMRLARGAGIGGMAGVRRQRLVRPGLQLIRPVLDWRKRELAAIALAAGIAPVCDPSNEDPAFDRTRARTLLTETTWFDPVRLAAAAAHLAEAEAALAWATDVLAGERIVGDTLDPAGLPPEIVRRLVLRQFARFDEMPRGPELGRLIAALRDGRPATLGSVKAEPGALWRFSCAPPRSFQK